MRTGTALKNTPADVLKYQTELIRTGQYLPLGRLQKIAIGPNASYRPPDDPIIRKHGRFIDLRDKLLPLGQSRDRSQVLICAPMLGADGRAGLPDLPDPEWVAPARSLEEIEGRKIVENGVERREVVKADPTKYTPRMIPQRLEDRTSQMLEGTEFLVFEPVEYFTFQPEIKGRLVGDAWRVKCLPDFSTKPATHVSLLVDRRTGDAHFFGGRFDIQGNVTGG